MTKVDDPAIERRRQDFQAQIDTLKQQIEDAAEGTDVSTHKLRLGQLEQELEDLKQQEPPKAARGESAGKHKS